MCCNRRRQQRLPQSEQFLSNLPVDHHPRGCHGTHKQRRLLRELEAQSSLTYQTFETAHFKEHDEHLPATRNHPRTPMAALIAVSIGIGAEKLGRKISEKRLERKDRKAAEVCLLS
jgi:hypothetical protein